VIIPLTIQFSVLFIDTFLMLRISSVTQVCIPSEGKKMVNCELERLRKEAILC